MTENKSKKKTKSPKNSVVEKVFTFDQYDKFERRDFADRLTRVITSFSPFYEESFVLSLNASYGSGKTKFLQMWKNHLEEMDSPYKVIYINAWETDFDEEPLIPIISAFIESLIIGNDGANKIIASLEGALGALVSVANSLVKVASGVDVKTTMEEVASSLDEKDLESVGRALYREYSYKKDAYQALKTELVRYVSKLERRPLMIFVDELDRVRPDYAIKFLEAIKHIFSVQGVCFVLAVDRDQLEISVSQLYGKIDFEKYYLRFITREVNLPNAINGNLLPFINAQIQIFFDKKQQHGVKFAFDVGTQNYVVDFTKTALKAFNFTPREVKNIFGMLSHIASISSDRKLVNISFICGIILLLCIYTKDKFLYHKIGKGAFRLDDLENILSNLSYDKNRWDQEKKMVTRCLASNALNDNNKDEVATLYLRMQGLSVNDQSIKETIMNLRSADVYSYENSNFEFFYTIIEDWSELIE